LRARKKLLSPQRKLRTYTIPRRGTFLKKLSLTHILTLSPHHHHLLRDETGTVTVRHVADLLL